MTFAPDLQALIFAMKSTNLLTKTRVNIWIRELERIKQTLPAPKPPVPESASSRTRRRIEGWQDTHPSFVEHLDKVSTDDMMAASRQSGARWLQTGSARKEKM